jgi:putative transposase
VRLRDYTPYGHWQTHTVVAALRVDGLTAPAVFNGPIDNPAFLAYVELTNRFGPWSRSERTEGA